MHSEKITHSPTLWPKWVNIFLNTRELLIRNQIFFLLALVREKIGIVFYGNNTTLESAISWNNCINNEILNRLRATETENHSPPNMCECSLTFLKISEWRDQIMNEKSTVWMEINYHASEPISFRIHILWFLNKYFCTHTIALFFWCCEN